MSNPFNAILILTVLGSLVTLGGILLGIYLVMRMNTTRRNQETLRKAVDEHAATIDSLVQAWNRAVAVCDECEKPMWVSEVALTINRRNLSIHYCKDCQHKANSSLT